MLDTATLHQEENGVRWYREQSGSNTVHIMQFEGQVLTGSWVGAKWVFRALTLMPVEERAIHHTHDEWIGVIHKALYK